MDKDRKQHKPGDGKKEHDQSHDKQWRPGEIDAAHEVPASEAPEEAGSTKDRKRSEHPDRQRKSGQS